MDAVALLDLADPYIAEALFGVFMTWGGVFVSRFLKTKQSQDSLHRAIETGVDLVTDRIGQIGVVDATVDKVVGYVYRSVPGSIKYLKADQAQITLMAQAKLNKKIVELVN